MKPLKQTSKGTNEVQVKVNSGVQANHLEPASKNPASMKAGLAPKNGDLAVPHQVQNTPLSHSAPVIRRQSKQSKQAIAAKLVQAMLSNKEGPFNRQQLLEFARSPLVSDEVRPIPRTWPDKVIAAKDVWTWGDELVKSHQKIFVKEGQRSYAKAVINVVFPDDVNKPAHLPEKLATFCLALDEQVIQQCRDCGLTEEEFDSVRMRVLEGFISGRVLCQHLRPKTMSMHDTQGWQMDADLLAAAADKLTLYLDKLLSYNDALLAPIPAPMPQKQQTVSSKMQIMEFLSPQQRELLAKTEYSDEFYKRADIYFNSSVKNKPFLIACLLSFYLKIPSDANGLYFSRLDKVEQFLYDERHTLDKLTREGQLYMLDQINIITTPDRRGTLSKASLANALEVATGMLPLLSEEDEGSDSTNT